MAREVLLSILLAIAVASCAHSTAAPSPHTLTVDYHGVRVFGPEKVQMEDRSVPLGEDCPAPIGGASVLQLQLNEAMEGYVYYSCYTSCFVGTGGGNTVKIVPGQSITLDCLEPGLRVALSEG